MAHIHEVVDTNTHFKIDPITRQITTEDELKVIIQRDHNSEKISFNIPKFIDGHDMTKCNAIKVHYINANTSGSEFNEGTYVVEDLHELEQESEMLEMSWLVSVNATQIAGRLNFLIEFACLSDQGTKEYVWNTAIYKSIEISEGMNCTDEITTEYPDILEQWKTSVLDEILSRVVNGNEVAY